MAIYQVNQGSSFITEYPSEYLCCPSGHYGGWPIMRKLKVGDVIYHYDSSTKLIRGKSEVIALPNEFVGKKLTLVCSEYCGQHLSFSCFDQIKQTELRKYSHFYVVYVKQLVPIDDPSLRNIIHKTFRGYLNSFP